MSESTPDARSLLHDLVVACRAYDSTKPSHVQEYSISLDVAEAFLQTPRSDSAPKLCPDCGCELECVKHGCAKKYAEHRDAALEEAANLAENWGNAPPNPQGRRAALATAIRALKGNAAEIYGKWDMDPNGTGPAESASPMHEVSEEEAFQHARDSASHTSHTATSSSTNIEHDQARCVAVPQAYLEALQGCLWILEGNTLTKAQTEHVAHCRAIIKRGFER